MDLKRLFEILEQTTTPLRDGVSIPGEWFGDDLEIVDCHYLRIAVNKSRAELHRGEFLSLLKEWPSEARGFPVAVPVPFTPDYLYMMKTAKDHDAVLLIMALGKGLDLWEVRIPKNYGYEGPATEREACQRFIFIDRTGK